MAVFNIYVSLPEGNLNPRKKRDTSPEVFFECVFFVCLFSSCLATKFLIANAYTNQRLAHTCRAQWPIGILNWLQWAAVKRLIERIQITDFKSSQKHALIWYTSSLCIITFCIIIPNMVEYQTHLKTSGQLRFSVPLLTLVLTQLPVSIASRFFSRKERHRIELGPTRWCSPPLWVDL